MTTLAIHRQGRLAEKRALKFLKAQGLTLLGKNLHFRCGEIDLMMLDKQSVVVVEVRQRTSSYMSALQSIDKRKQRKLVLAMHAWRQKHNKWRDHAFRFDVVTIDGDAKTGKLQWVKQAFYADD